MRSQYSQDELEIIKTFEEIRDLKHPVSCSANIFDLMLYQKLIAQKGFRNWEITPQGEGLWIRMTECIV